MQLKVLEDNLGKIVIELKPLQVQDTPHYSSLDLTVDCNV